MTPLGCSCLEVFRTLIKSESYGATGLTNSDVGAQGRINVAWLDRTDCVGSWQSENLAAVVFCTADCLPQLRNIDGECQRDVVGKNVDRKGGIRAG